MNGQAANHHSQKPKFLFLAFVSQRLVRMAFAIPSLRIGMAPAQRASAVGGYEIEAACADREYSQRRSKVVTDRGGGGVGPKVPEGKAIYRNQ